jgi:ATP-dependent RNA helicase RhlE
MPLFHEFDLDDAVLDGIDAMGYTQPSPIQELAIPYLLENRDLIGCAQTGTGKTAAYLLPLMNKILRGERDGIQALIVAPTRELALQIDQALTGFSYYCGISSIAVYGGGKGEDFEREKKALSTGCDIVIATPGRLLSHFNLGYVKTDHLKTLILDEADRMLDMGFNEDIMRINGYLPKDKQTVMFSATMPSRIRHMAGQLMRNPAEVNIAISKPAAGIKQLAYCVYDTQKVPLLMRIMKDPALISVIIFSSTKQNVKNMEKELKKLGLNIAAIHSDLEQNEREEVLLKFRNRDLKILVATDVLSRGIDIDNISMVLNYDVPGDAEDYIHRVGRTARAETKGEAITFVSPDDMRKFGSIEKLIGYEVEKGVVPAELGEVPVYNANAKSSGGNKGGGGKKSFGRRKPGGGNSNHRSAPKGNHSHQQRSGPSDQKKN